MSASEPQTKSWMVGIIILLLSISTGIAAFVYRSTTQVSEALAAEILEQQHDIALLIQDYGNVMLAVERQRNSKNETRKSELETIISSALSKLEKMRSNYSFEQLEGASQANTYVKPVLEDVSQWTTQGIYEYPANDPFVLDLAAQRLTERFDAIQNISLETDIVANELISEQTSFLEKFRDSMFVLLAGFAALSVAIAALLIRQRNLQAQLAIDQEINAQKIIDAETRGRHNAEEALQGSEQFLRATLDSLPSDIAILDQHGVITAVNTPWKTLVSANKPEYADGGIGHHYESVFKSTAMTNMEKRGINMASERVDQVLSKTSDNMFYEYPCHRDEKKLWSRVSMSTFNTDEGRHAVLVHEDVSQRKRLEERDLRLRAELAHVSRLTTAGELATGLAHELNQPLTAITHNCDAVMSSVRSQVDDPELIDTVNDISEQAQHAGSIIRSMRHLVRKDTSDKAPTNINELVKETVRLTGPEAREKGVIVILNLADNLPEPIVDRVQIQQVLVNLERNGVEAMWQHDSTVKELTIQTGLAANSSIEVCISDTGPGVAPEFSKHLFSAFQTTKKAGMGLGLSISRSIVEEHGGRLWIDPDAENVTMFRFTIPFQPR